MVPSAHSVVEACPRGPPTESHYGFPQLARTDEEERNGACPLAPSCRRTTVGASVTRTGPHSVRITVTDTSRVRPTADSPNDDEGRGRGLQLVEAVADDWGAEVVHGGKRVWAHLTAEASP